MKDLVIWGCGGHGRELAGIAEDINMGSSVGSRAFNILGFLDDRASLYGQQLAGYPILGGLSWMQEHPSACVCVGVGKPVARFKTVARLRAIGAQFSQALVHPTVTIAKRSTIGPGSVIFPGCVISVDVRIGAHVVLNIGTTISHDCILDDFVTAAPGVHVAGAVELGEGCDLGTASNTIQCLKIGAWTIVGAGATIIQSLNANITAVGVPARTIKTRPEGWHLTQ